MQVYFYIKFVSAMSGIEKPLCTQSTSAYGFWGGVGDSYRWTCYASKRAWVMSLALLKLTTWIGIFAIVINIHRGEFQCRKDLRTNSTTTLILTRHARGMYLTITNSLCMNYRFGSNFSIPTGHFDKHCIAKSLTGFFGQLLSLLRLDIHRYLKRKRMLLIYIQYFDIILKNITIKYTYMCYISYPRVYYYIWMNTLKIT